MGKGKALSLDLRERIVAAVEKDDLTYEDAAARFSVGRASVSRFLGKAKRSETLVPGVRSNPPTKLDDDDRATLAAIIEAEPDGTLPEFRDQLLKLTDKTVSLATVGREVRALKFTRKKRRSSPRSS